jgi:thiamine biosynthesis lipoprotein
MYAAAQKAGQLPDPAAIAATRKTIDWRRVEITPRRVQLHGSRAEVTLNGIAQGFAADRAMAALRQHGVQHALVNTGEIGCLGQKSPGDPWTVGIQHPRRADAFISLARLDGRCLATSGDYATSFSHDHRYNHLFDPRTGDSPQELASVSIAARTAMQADALSTAVFVLGAEKGLQLIQSTPQADGFLVLKDGSVLATDGFPQNA